MKIKDKTILIISPEAWGAIYVSKHHYAHYLSKENSVFFLNPAIAPRNGKYGSMHIEQENAEVSLTVITYNNLLPKLNQLPKFIQRKIYKKQANQILKFLPVDQIDIIWSFDPFRYFDLHVWRGKMKIYHTVDVHFNKCFEHDIASSADLVLLSSEMLYTKLSKDNHHIYNIGHAADTEHFSGNKNEVVSLPGNQKIKAGLVGNFNNNVDYDLIESIAVENPSIDFIFVGPYTSENLGTVSSSVATRIEEINGLTNVYFVGSVHSNEVILWLNSFDINLVLYREDKRDIIINPHKMMGYFYTGKITVCSWFNEYKDTSHELLIMRNHNHEIPATIKEVAHKLDYWNQEKFKQRRRNFAEQNSYPLKIEKIGQLLSEIESEKLKR